MESRTVTFNGDTYVQQPSGYYFKYTTRNAERRHAKQLHRAVWEFYNGPIPDGCHIHHVDGNKDNNDISNLECISAKEHISMHSKRLMQDPARKEANRQQLAEAQELAKKWHASEEGKDWHRKHTAESLAKAWVKTEHTCEYCGKKFMTIKTGRYCSALCGERARTGRKLQKKRCAWCDRSFETMRPQQVFCSSECRCESEKARRRKK
jgi:hypothetical protein